MQVKFPLAFPFTVTTLALGLVLALPAKAFENQLSQPQANDSAPETIAYFRPFQWLNVQSNTYTIRLYDQQGQMYMDVANRQTGEKLISRAVAESVRSQESITYLNRSGDTCYQVKVFATGYYIVEVNHNGRTIAHERGQVIR